MCACRPTYRLVTLLVFAIVLNALAWGQARADTGALGIDELCVQAHGAPKPSADPGALDHSDTCVQHCVGVLTPFGEPAFSMAPPVMRMLETTFAIVAPRLAVVRRATWQPRAPPVN